MNVYFNREKISRSANTKTIDDINAISFKIVWENNKPYIDGIVVDGIQLEANLNQEINAIHIIEREKR